MDWFKTKGNPEEEMPTAVDDALLPLVRTMGDDLAGREVPTKLVPKTEPLVGFDPNATTGAAFYAAPGVVTAESMGNSPETSPFFQEAEESKEPSVSGPTDTPVPVAEPVVVVQQPSPSPSLVQENVSIAAAAPPKELPVVSENSLKPEEKLSEESQPVALNVIQAQPGASFEGVLPTSNQAMTRLKDVLSQGKLKWLLLAGTGVLLILIGGGVYFWRMSQDKASIPGEITNSPLKPSTDKTTQTEPAPQKQYQADQPNILSFDTETVTPAEIKAALLQAGQGIKKDGLTGAVEFIVRDQKLNPLALSRFAYLAKIELPTSLLEILDESFSIYIFIDQDRPRAVLLAYAKDQEALSMELQKNEKSLPTAIEPLFLDMTTAPKSNLSFRDGSYLERPVRFTNVDAALGLSVDYAVRGKQWIIGTSKDSLRAVLDKTGL
ncbi:MAG: hypothetical protein ACEQSB_03505 [Undibacterium sp.]